MPCYFVTAPKTVVACGGEDVKKVERKHYGAYQRLRNFACVTGRQDKRLLKVRPAEVELVPGFTGT